MLVLKFNDRRYNKEVVIKGENFKNIYYKLGERVNSSYPYFYEEKFLNENKVRKEVLTDDNYLDFIDEQLRTLDYNIAICGVYYFDEIYGYSDLSWREKDLVDDNLLKTGKVFKEKWSGRLYTNDYALYEQLERELEDN